MKPESSYFIHESSYVDDDVEIGKGTTIWHFSHIQSGARIGEDCTIGQNINIGNNVMIGNNVKIQNNVSVYERVELQDYVFCGPSVVFTNILRPRSKFPQKGGEHYLKTIVMKSATLGANCTILCGVTIGEYAFVGAGSVITKDVSSHSLVIGNPAKHIAWVDDKGSRLFFDESNISSCKKFLLDNGEIIRTN
jgi:UDP-2-acetamido-3-amino-2,3-dideoxy-glucuronate N-acetyltransferase|tara:strand:+ start:221 stop:799 length:579 start_codon:yes stop_codon:yes gene_type:complete